VRLKHYIIQTDEGVELNLKNLKEESAPRKIEKVQEINERETDDLPDGWASFLVRRGIKSKHSHFAASSSTRYYYPIAKGRDNEQYFQIKRPTSPWADILPDGWESTIRETDDLPLTTIYYPIGYKEIRQFNTEKYMRQERPTHPWVNIKNYPILNSSRSFDIKNGYCLDELKSIRPIGGNVYYNGTDQSKRIFQNIQNRDAFPILLQIVELYNDKEGNPRRIDPDIVFSTYKCCTTSMEFHIIWLLLTTCSTFYLTIAGNGPLLILSWSLWFYTFIYYFIALYMSHPSWFHRQGYLCCCGWLCRFRAYNTTHGTSMLMQ
jgi:hypothetical protein